MGQQQLLLLVFGLIVVALAVLAALTAIPEKMRQSEADNLVNRNLEISTAAVAWKSIRDPYNGGNMKYTGLETNGFTKLFMESSTHRGEFEMTVPSAYKLQITGVSTRYSDIGVRTYVTDYKIDSTVIRFDGSFTID